MRSIHVELYDGDLIGSDFIGAANIPMPSSRNKDFPLASGYRQRVIADLFDLNGKAAKSVSTNYKQVGIVVVLSTFNDQ